MVRHGTWRGLFLNSHGRVLLDCLRRPAGVFVVVDDRFRELVAKTRRWGYPPRPVCVRSGVLGATLATRDDVRLIEAYRLAGAPDSELPLWLVELDGECVQSPPPWWPNCQFQRHRSFEAPETSRGQFVQRPPSAPQRSLGKAGAPYPACQLELSLVPLFRDPEHGQLRLAL